MAADLDPRFSSALRKRLLQLVRSDLANEASHEADDKRSTPGRIAHAIAQVLLRQR